MERNWTLVQFGETKPETDRLEISDPDRRKDDLACHCLEESIRKGCNTGL
jgi:hypothetical protein